MARAFTTAGLDTPELDARVLLQAALGCDHAGLLGQYDRKLTPHEAEHIAGFAARRLGREPIAYIIGEKEFWGLPLKVTAATLVPRPETETVVEAALAAIDRGGPRTRVMWIADLGAGSGALLLALLSELPHAYGVGADCCPQAVAVARDNAERLALTQRGAFVVADFAAALRGGFDLIVSNPPYIESDAIASLAPDVRDWEPRLALDGGENGLSAYRAIAVDSARLLAAGGHLVVEIGIGQATAVAALFEKAGLALANAPVCDLAGIPRALILQRK